MAAELNVPTHRWHEPRNNIALPPEDYSKHYIYETGIQKIDAWINSQPWGNPAVYLPFIPSGSDGLIAADSLVFKVVGVASPEEWAIEGSMIMQSPTPPDAANYRIVGTTVEAV